VEAFREDTNMLVIDPDVCIDCGACASECPVQAIYPDGDVPAKWAQYVALNKTKAPSLPMINSKKDPLKK
jgi:ferredoxin